VPSLFGVRCQECGYRGFLITNHQFRPECSCYDAKWSPSSNCLPSPQFVNSNSEFVILTETSDDIYCESFQSKTLGCFASTPKFDYGQEFPPTPTECCSNIIGPPPGQLIETGLAAWEECNTYGSFNPDVISSDSYFSTCSGHGWWDPLSYSCDCYPSWNAVNIGIDPFENSDLVYSCKTCFGFWGPPPPLDAPLDEVEQAHCSVIWTPDEFGEVAECSGHGEYKYDTCICHRDEIRGYWDLLEMKQVFTRILGNGTKFIESHTIQTCAQCMIGASGPMCRLTSGQLVINQEIPTLTPTTSCLVCPYEPQIVLTGVLFQTISFIPSNPTCCTALTSIISLPSTIIVSSGTCLLSPQNQMHLGFHWCAQLNCTRFTSTIDQETVRYKFTQSSGAFDYIQSSRSSSAQACPPTISPTLLPTLFPTQYPSIYY
jgi:hypothetical protein